MSNQNDLLLATTKINLEEIEESLQAGDAENARYLAEKQREWMVNFSLQERELMLSTSEAWITAHANGHSSTIREMLGMAHSTRETGSDVILENAIFEMLTEAGAVRDNNPSRFDELITTAIKSVISLKSPLAETRLRRDFSRLAGVTVRDYDALLKAERLKRAEPAPTPPTVTAKFDFANDVVFTGDYNASILAQHLRGRAFFTDGLGWLWFDGKRFVKGEAPVKEFARKLFRDCLAESARESDNQRRMRLAIWYSKTLDNAQLEKALKLCETDERTCAEVGEFDSNPVLFNCANGTLNLKTGELQPHSPTDKITKLSPVEYKPGAAMFDWLEFIERVVPDSETRAFLQRAAGYTLTGLTIEHALFWLHGVGRNGKSTFVETLAYVLGDYATGADFQTFTERRGDSIGDMTGWAGARMIASAEHDKGRRVNESLLKNITGGDKFRVRLLYRDAFDIHPQFKLWASFNDKPIISGTDEGIWRRIRLIPFDVTIPENEVDPNLPERLKRYADGILRWMVEGCAAWREQGLGLAPAVQRATSAYRGESDIFTAWLEECCVTHSNAKQTAGELFASYERWAAGNAERVMNRREFSDRLKRAGFENDKGAKGVRLWKGVGLITE